MFNVQSKSSQNYCSMRNCGCIGNKSLKLWFFFSMQKSYLCNIKYVPHACSVTEYTCLLSCVWKLKKYPDATICDKIWAKKSCDISWEEISLQQWVTCTWSVTHYCHLLDGNIFAAAEDHASCIFLSYPSCATRLIANFSVDASNRDLHDISNLVSFSKTTVDMPKKTCRWPSCIKTKYQ